VNVIIVMGVSIGALIGVVSGIMGLLFLRDAFSVSSGRYSWWENTFGRRPPSGVKLAGKFSTLPLFWVGGYWTAAFVKQANWSELLPYYLVSLAIVFIVIMLIPLMRLIVKISGLIK
jgi:hypothetical protein